jgi:phosphate transport system ATP-binding protein
MLKSFKSQNAVKAIRGMAGDKIRTRDLKLWYGAKQALNGITFDIPSNSLTAIIGPSGCGKSTFIRCLNRMNDTIPRCRVEGAVEIGGRDINSRDFDVVGLRRSVGMVFQKPNPFPMSIYENVAYGPKMAGIRDPSVIDDVVSSAVGRAGLSEEVSDRMNDVATSLSGGQQQRLCIARALAMEPEIILMDEPCSALDPRSTATIEKLMVKLSETYTVVVVTHNMQQAARVSEYAAFFYTGDLVEFGKTDKMFHEPENEKTGQYLSGVFG